MTASVWYGGGAICKSEGAIFTCYLEGKGGDIKLTPLPDGGVHIWGFASWS